MTRALLLLLLSAGACRTNDAPPPIEPFGPPAADAPGLLVRGHSHNDYEQARPLLDALDARLYSVEADLWWSDDAVLVSHRPWDYAGELERLYLAPLQARVDLWGSVYGDGAPFHLWLDLKEGEEPLTSALHEMLDRYSMLTRYTDAGVEPGPVTAILTGDDEAKRRFVEQFADRRATRDGHSLTPEDPPADGSWGFYAFNWESWSTWTGEGELPASERAAIAAVVTAAHEKGRPVRFWNLPDTEAGWQAALDADIDFINTDRPDALAAFLLGATAP